MTELSGPVRQPASGTTKQLIIFLHGLGADGNDLIGLSPIFAQVLPDAAFMSPNAPQPCDMAPYGYQWFSLQTRDPVVMIQGISESAPKLDTYITAQLKKFNLTEADLALVGFSQGCMMALHVGLQRTKPLAAIVGFSGALVGADMLAAEARTRAPVCLIHGDADPVVPYAAMNFAVTGLQAAKVNVQSHTRKGLGHGIDEEGIEIAQRFLVQSFADANVAG